MKVNLSEFKSRVSEFIKAVEKGERVTICRRGIPVADLVRSAVSMRRKPKLGTLRGKVKVHDPNWWKPMTDEEAEAFLEGRY